MQKFAIPQLLEDACYSNFQDLKDNVECYG
jgi:hypothetical protein